MRIVTAFLIGAVLGAALGAGALLFNPLLEHSGEPPSGELLYYQSNADQFVLTHGETLPVPLKPTDVPPMWEATIKGAGLTVFPLNDADGNAVALASRVSILGERSDLLFNGPRLDSAWLLTFPGKGTLFVEEQENVWQVLREGVVPAWLLSGSWSGERELLPTSGPAVDGARVVAGSGDFAGSSGILRQRYRIGAFARQNVTWEAEVGVQLTAVTEQAEATE